MKWKTIVVLTWVLSSVACAQVRTELGMESPETYIQVYPNDNVLVIREYSLSTLIDEEGREDQIQQVKELVESNNYAKSRFGLEGFVAIEEKMFTSQDIIIGEYTLFTEELEPEELIKVAFGSIMNQDVRVTYSEEEIGLFFQGTGVSVSYNNAKGVFERGDEAVAFWDGDLTYLELVIGSSTRAVDDYVSIAPYFGEDVSSPPLLTEAGTNTELQYDFDIARLKDLEVLSGYIEKYKVRTGIYPLQGASILPNYIFIATQEQQQYVRGGPDYEHATTPVSELINELQNELGEDITIPFDPQRVAVNKPNFYIYMIDGDTYYLAIHLFENYAFSNEVAEHYNKLEITNSSETFQGQWSREELLSDSNFIDALGRTPYRQGYIEDLREGLGGNSAF